MSSENQHRLKNLDISELNSSFAQMSWQKGGRVCDVVGTVIEAHLPNANLGMICEVDIPSSKRKVLGEIVGFREKKTLIIPYSNLAGVSPGNAILGQKSHDHIQFSSNLLGHVLDPFLNPLNGDTITPAQDLCQIPIDKDAPNPMSRKRISEPLSLGVKVVDGLLTFGKGQRTGIFAGSGVGKSVLMGMVARNSSADVNVIALIGERGREVREFLEKELGEEGCKRSVVIVVTSDQSPLMRLRGAKVATAIAEGFSNQGKQVLLMMDSLTRVAQAQREIGLAVGEPPTTKGYPPSVFSLLPRLLERCGPQSKEKGSISGIYTVLVDADDFNDPMPDAARSILDGHLQLSRNLASKGHFPAIEVTTSVSRVMNDITSSTHQSLAKQIIFLISTYEENIDFIKLGTYSQGSNPTLDLAIQVMPLIEKFLKQTNHEGFSFEETLNEMIAIHQKSQGLINDQ